MTDLFNTQLDDVRSKIQSLNQKIIRISQGRAQDKDKITVGREMQEAEQALQNLQAEFKRALPNFDTGEAKTYDEQLTYLQGKMQNLNKQYKNYQAQAYTTFHPEEVSPEDVTVENMKLMQKQKEENLSQLHNQIKQIGRTNQIIKEELDKGDEKAADLKQNIQHSNVQVVSANTRTKQFTLYLKKNKAPFCLTIIFLIITVIIWASKAFCSWGFTWQCP